MFEVREIESDISFIRNYLTKELVMREDLYLFQKQAEIIKSSIKSGSRFATSS
nr:SpoVR family protein [Bacillus subtilis]